jgi:hypothetical protein
MSVIWGIDRFHIVDMTPPGGSFNIEYIIVHMMNPLLAKVFPEGRKSYVLRLSAHRAIVGFIRQMLRNSFDEIPLLLFLIRHTVLAWRHPTFGFSAISRHLLQVVHSMMLMNFLRRSSSF